MERERGLNPRRPAWQIERIGLPQAQRQLRIAFQVAAYEAVFTRARFQRQDASVIGGGHAVLLGQSQHTEDTAHGHFPLPLVQSLAQRAHVRFSYGDTMRQLLRAGLVPGCDGGRVVAVNVRAEAAR